MAFDPRVHLDARFAAGLVYVAPPEGSTWSFAGSCAAYTSRDIVLTAGHCVPEGLKASVYVAMDSSPRRVRAVVRHPTQDLAICHLAPSTDPDHPFQTQFYAGVTNLHLAGLDFVGFGYPVEQSEDGQPDPRHFKGYFHRVFLRQTRYATSEWSVDEMSIPAPLGFSGGVLASTHEPRLAAAVVVENHESSIQVQEIQQVEKGGVIYKDTIHRFVSFGIALDLSGMQSWLATAVAQTG